MEKKPHILLVDDEQAITSNLAAYLNRSGFESSIAGDGEQALYQVQLNPPDLIVLDVLMPKVDGREVLRQLCQAGDWTPAILLTLVGEASERAMALEERADDYLNKPFDPHELVARMRAVLRRARPGHCLMFKAMLLALLNLLGNAVKFSEPGATVEVRAFEDANMVIIEVADTGPGIPESEVPFVWQELYRGQGARGGQFLLICIYP